MNREMKNGLWTGTGFFVALAALTLVFRVFNYLVTTPNTREALITLFVLWIVYSLVHVFFFQRAHVTDLEASVEHWREVARDDRERIYREYGMDE